MQPDCSILDRFLSKVDQNGDCWNWTGPSFVGIGYGRLKDPRADRSILAHRLSYELYYGPIPDGMQVCHHCDNPACVRPDHLFLGTQLDNVHDMVDKGRHRFPIGEQHPVHKLSAAQVAAARRLYARGGIAQTELAALLGISPTAARNIIYRRRWRHVA